MTARDPFYVVAPTIPPGMTVGEYRRGRPARRPTVRRRVARALRAGDRHGA